MYPTTEVKLSAKIPSSAEFWTPTQDDLEADEGFGYFDNTWPIHDVSEQEATNILRIDQTLSLVANKASGTVFAFDDIATALETGSAEDIDGLDSSQLEAIQPYLIGEV